MSKKEIITDSAKETRGIGEILAKEITAMNNEQRAVNNYRKETLIIGLQGELGSGKTTFIQGLAKGLGVKEKITSPTFVILKKYKIPSKIIKDAFLFHIDCYRIKSEDLLELGFEEIANDSQNIVVIEWAERAKKILKNALWIKFEYLGKSKRKILCKNS